jgi:long-chain acyl-CoA synthetase
MTEADLLAPGAPFELEDAVVLGEPMRVIKQRFRSLRQIVAASQQLGETEGIVFRDAGGFEARLSFGEHARRVAVLAERLRRVHGVESGDRVAILAANRLEWLLSFWATVSLGAVAVGLNAWWTEPELRFALEDCQPKLLVIDEKRLARLGSTEIPMLVMERDFADLSGQTSLPDTLIGEDDPAVILYTSGTTGRPKGAVHSHRNVIGLVGLNFFHGARLRLAEPLPPDAPPNCVLVTSPLFHVSGLHSAAITALAGGSKTIWTMGRFDAAFTARLIAEERVTAWAYTSTLLHRLVHESTQADLSTIRQIGGGGSPIAPALQRAARERFPGAQRTFGVGYGLTECTALATLAFGAELAAEPTSVGRPMPTVELEIRDERGVRVADGIEGEIHVRGPLVMLEYWRRPEETQQAILPGRWLRTGDIGRLDSGRLTLATRKRDLILRGGENVYPVEIEQRLELHPDVAEAAVIGVDHPELGQEVKAVVVPRAAARPDPDDLARWVAQALAYFKVPAHWELRAAPLPRNATGKVLKHVLRDGGAPSFTEE